MRVYTDETICTTRVSGGFQTFKACFAYKIWVTRQLLTRMLRCDWLVFSSCDWCISILAVSVCCAFGGPLSYRSPVVVFVDRGHPCFRNFYSTIPVDFDVVRVKSYVSSLFDPACIGLG